MSVPLLQARDLTCERDDRLLFHKLDLSILPGSLTRVEGANGSGKTTLLRILAGLNSGYDGSVLWCGQPIAHCREHMARHLLYVGHRSAIKPALTPLENLRFSTLPSHRFRTAQLESALEAVDLLSFADMPCQSLSAGQQRRVALARLYLSDEPLWILDEAFTAIDQEGVSALESLLQARANAGGAIVMTTHHPLADEQVTRIQLGETAGVGRESLEKPESVRL